ncbi:hypothetical protein GX48_00117 [Paracoccidioides brasiliensis]|nr:hypothetical protein GX48_00117 [Paracoccidioides brasiliensis]
MHHPISAVAVAQTFQRSSLWWVGDDRCEISPLSSLIFWNSLDGPTYSQHELNEQVRERMKPRTTKYKLKLLVSSLHLMASQPPSNYLLNPLRGMVIEEPGGLHGWVTTQLPRYKSQDLSGIDITGPWMPDARSFLACMDQGDNINMAGGRYRDVGSIELGSPTPH